MREATNFGTSHPFEPSSFRPSARAPESLDQVEMPASACGLGTELQTVSLNVTSPQPSRLQPQPPTIKRAPFPSGQKAPVFDRIAC